MRRAAVQRLARQAATLAESSAWGPAGIAASSGQDLPACQALGRTLAAAGTCRPAAAAAAQPWARSLHACAAAERQPWRGQQHAALASSPWQPNHQQQQQRRGAAAQAAEAPASTSGSGGLALSDSAVERLKELQAQAPGPVALRVLVEGGGCSGFQYEFAIEDWPDAPLAETDRLFEREGVRVVVDDISLEFLKGATVDFESDLMRSAFVIASNPNAASSCGCGSSFVAK